MLLRCFMVLVVLVQTLLNSLPPLFFDVIFTLESIWEQGNIVDSSLYIIPSAQKSWVPSPMFLNVCDTFQDKKKRSRGSHSASALLAKEVVAKRWEYCHL